MTLQNLLVILKARWLSAALVFVAVVATVVGASLLMPRQYTAWAAVLLDVRSPDPIAGMVLPGMSTSSYMGTQAGVIQSERVVLRAVRAMGLERNTALREQWMLETGASGNLGQWIAARLIPGLQVRPTRDANLISVAYTARDPAFAAAVANAVVQAYTDVTLELRVEPARRYNQFFDERSAQSRTTLEQAQARLSAFQRERGIVATDERLDTENLKLGELTSQLVALQAVAAESSTRHRHTDANPGATQDVLSSALVSGLTADLARQEALLDEMAARLGSRHPQMLEQQAKLAQLRSRIDAESRRVGRAVGLSDTINQQRLAQLRAEIDKQRSRLLHLRAERDEAAVLLRDVQSAQQNYDAVMARLSQTGLESQTTQTNVAVLKEATPPLAPSAPRVALNTAAATVLGLILGLATVLVRERLDPRLRLATAVQEQLQQPVLGELPVWTRSAKPRPARLRLTGLRPAGYS